MRKGIFAILLVVALVFNTLSTAFAANTGGLFSDLGEYHYAREYATKCYDLGIINVSEDNCFYPNHKITLAEAVDGLYRIGLSLGKISYADISNKNQVSSFEDVNSNAWYYDALVWAVSLSIITPENSTKLGTFNIITKLEYSRICYNFLDTLKITIENKYSQTYFNDISHLSQDDQLIIDSLAKKNLLGNVENINKFMPDSTFVKGSMVILFGRLIDATGATKSVERPAVYNSPFWHVELDHKYVEPTCTEPGIKKHKYCPMCGYQDEYQLEIAAKGHDNYETMYLEKFETKDEPSIVWYLCKECGEYNSQTEYYHDIYYHDVTPDDWYYFAVKFADFLGLMNGTSDYMFSPNIEMSRAMLVTVLYRYVGMPDVNGTAPFVDLDTNQTWYHDAVLWAYQNNIVTGTSSNTFSPELSVSREQLATILYRFVLCLAGITDVPTVTDKELITEFESFIDVSSVSNWAYDGMLFAYSTGLITGAQKGNNVCLAPQDIASRAQVATVFMRFSE